MPPVDDDVIKRYRAHNDAIERKHRNQLPPSGKLCKEPGCTRGAFPWDDRCPPCEKKHQKALRAANAKPIASRPGPSGKTCADCGAGVESYERICKTCGQRRAREREHAPQREGGALAALVMSRGGQR